MRDSTYRHIVSVLRDYKYTDRYIKEREEELRYPYRQAEENIGGGRSSFVSNPTERMAITISDDRRLANLERNRNIVDKVYRQSDVVTKEVIDCMYFDSSCNTVQAAQEVNISDRHVRRLHSAFVEKVADEMGLMK